MSEARYIDWYDVVQAVANGRTEGHTCPVCESGRLQSAVDLAEVRVWCPACGEGFTGRLKAGRDDALYAEAAAMEARKAAKRTGTPIERTAIVAGGLCAPLPGVDAAALTPGVTMMETPARTTSAPADDGEPWRWTLPPGTDDVQGLADWMDVVESIHNGRSVGLKCPYCSEPLDDITHRAPFVRVRCAVCGEGFEGRLG